MEHRAAYLIFFPHKSTKHIVTCGFLFVKREGDEHELFFAHARRDSFQHNPLFRPRALQTIEGYEIDNSELQVIFITNVEEDMVKVYSLCYACSLSRKKFNYTDRYMSHFLLYMPKDDKDIYEAEKVHSAQAIVLIMRACFGCEHPVVERVNGVNSRLVSPTSLRDSLLGMPLMYGLKFLKI